MANSRALFRATVFGGALLLFLGEPMAAKQLLPVFGGSAAVWMTCLVYFQLALLAGYWYAGWMSRAPSAGRVGRAWLHRVLVLAALGFAISWAVRGGVPSTPERQPVLGIFFALTLSVGLPFAVLGATSPLMQCWWARLEEDGVPYRLFALSNAASLLGLLLYPAVLEPWLTLRMQRWAWAGGLAIFAALSILLSQRVERRAPVTNLEEVRVSVPMRVRVLWFLLPLCGAMQLSAVTGHITTNIAAVPLLWVVPLAVYLLTFIAAFSGRVLLPKGLTVRLLAVLLAGLGYMLSRADVSLPVDIAVLFFLAEMFVACLLLHGELYERRPAGVRASSTFYLTVAAGGAAGSYLIGIAAPLLFSANYDVGLTFLLTAVLVLVLTWNDGASQRLLWGVGSVLMVVLLFALQRDYARGTLVATRNFYGSLRVRQSISTGGDPIRTLLNGTIQHGTEIFSGTLSHVPTTYYADDSGVGLAIWGCCPGRAKNVGVIGLGAGTVAAYGRPRDRMRFYELDPAVQPIARNVFTYLKDSGASVSVMEGDARTTLAAEPAQGFDVLVVDAFSGDAIPLHLLTREAMAVYRRQLALGGVLAFHVSNRYVNLEPEIGALAVAEGWEARTVRSAGNPARGEFSATWVLLAHDAGWFERAEVADRVTAVEVRPGLRAWTDDFSSLASLVRW